MTKQAFFSLCLSSFGVSPDYPFEEDFETAVLRHGENRKWFAVVMKVPGRKFGFDREEKMDIVNLKLPLSMSGSFGAADGVYPAYHMNKLHWISVLLSVAPDDLIAFLAGVSYDVTRGGKAKKGGEHRDKRPGA